MSEAGDGVSSADSQAAMYAIRMYSDAHTPDNGITSQRLETRTRSKQFGDIRCKLEMSRHGIF